MYKNGLLVNGQIINLIKPLRISDHDLTGNINEVFLTKPTFNATLIRSENMNFTDVLYALAGKGKVLAYVSNDDYSPEILDAGTFNFRSTLAITYLDGTVSYGNDDNYYDNNYIKNISIFLDENEKFLQPRLIDVFVDFTNDIVNRRIYRREFIAQYDFIVTNNKKIFFSIIEMKKCLIQDT